MPRFALCALLLWGSLLQAAPPVLVIALDGFRWDFAEREKAPNLLALKKEGAAVESLMPAFPSTTFPNFYAMATGLYPEHHNLVGMMFYDRSLKKGFQYWRNSSEGFWYGGTPIWLLAEQHHVKAATFFWPGSDASIQGRNPSHFRKYDGRITNEARVKQVLDWLRLPDAQRPGLVMAYFSDVDGKGHALGPDATETREAIARLDALTGDLVRQARAIHPEMNIVVLSDHGMTTVVDHVNLSGRADFRGCIAANEAPMTMLYCDEPERVRAELIRNAPEVEVFRRAEVPAHLHYRDNPRIGDLVLLPKKPIIIEILPPGDADSKVIPQLKGMHGYDPEKYKDMRGILIGVGPAFRSGTTAPSARTVDVFPLLCRLLGLPLPAGLDADLNRVKPLLR
ncbi:ectonucleotide pyrophosphatase/phosphodiesterase [uncultured Paludibaculum sp.]|uniref:alkaline phosphatase family protein n=1 Tax=uncultured Paludibaculum sp. TaxID=1765020 RepID=UPI002AAB9011|nr:ectonucleotide pyrophosphatase/phosphodiesterase [uncultured Paludibaculum sp.]